MEFKLHQRLQDDTFFIAEWELCKVLLMNDRTYPWLILVPQRENITEVLQLCANDQKQLMNEIVFASKLLQQEFQPDKINVGMLGNLVPQLHVHVIARFNSDPAWPGPVWGATKSVAYEEEEFVMRLQALQLRSSQLWNELI